MHTYTNLYILLLRYKTNNDYVYACNCNNRKHKTYSILMLTYYVTH